MDIQAIFLPTLVQMTSHWNVRWGPFQVMQAAFQKECILPCLCRDHSVASQWDMICSQSWMLQLANSGFFLGSLGGLVLFQQVAEELGEQDPTQYSPLLLRSAHSGAICLRALHNRRLISGICAPASSTMQHLSRSDCKSWHSL